MLSLNIKYAVFKYLNIGQSGVRGGNSEDVWGGVERSRHMINTSRSVNVNIGIN